MIKIDSIKKLKKHLRDIAQYNDETFNLPNFRLKTIIKYDYEKHEKRILAKPHVALLKCRYFIYHDANNVLHEDAYEFANNICHTEFILSKDNPDKIIKVIFKKSNSPHKSNEIVSVQRLHKYVANLLDSSVEHNIEEVKDEHYFSVKYETVTTKTETETFLAQSKDDAIKRVTERYSSRDNIKFTLEEVEELSLSESA
jgi:hypothetical protein